MNFTQWNRGSTVRSFIFTQTYSINTDNLHFKTHFLFGFFIKHGFMYQCSTHSLKVHRIDFHLRANLRATLLEKNKGKKRISSPVGTSVTRLQSFIPQKSTHFQKLRVKLRVRKSIFL